MEFRAASDDFRPTVILDDVNDVWVDRTKFPHAEGATPLRLKYVGNLDIRNNPGLADGHYDLAADVSL